MSNEKNLGWLGYIGDEMLPSYIGITINHYNNQKKTCVKNFGTSPTGYFEDLKQTALLFIQLHSFLEALFADS